MKPEIVYCNICKRIHPPGDHSRNAERLEKLRRGDSGRRAAASVSEPATASAKKRDDEVGAPSRAERHSTPESFRPLQPSSDSAEDALARVRSLNRARQKRWRERQKEMKV